MSLEIAMRLSGHKSIQTVQKHYREVSWAELERAIRGDPQRKKDDGQQGVSGSN